MPTLVEAEENCCRFLPQSLVVHLSGPDLEEVQDFIPVIGGVAVQVGPGHGNVAGPEALDHPLEDIPVGLRRGQAVLIALLGPGQPQLGAFTHQGGVETADFGRGPPAAAAGALAG